MAIADKAGFIIRETLVKSVPHVPELRLHLADEAMALWQKTEDELGEIGLPPPFWAFAWAGGQALARYILDTPALVKDKTVLDFACGSGLVGIAAMMAGGRSCTCVDIDDFAIEATRLNAALNEVTIATTRDDLTAGAPPQADVMFCGDVFYDRPMATKILAFLDLALESGTDVLVGDPGRSYLPKHRLDHLATYEVPVVGALEDMDVKRSSVYRLRATSGPE